MSLFMKKNKPQDMPISKPKPNRKRSERLSLGLTPDEKNMIRNGAKEAGMSQTDFIVASVKGTQILVLTGLPEMLLELNRQGCNLNQIARYLNEKGYASHTEIQKTCQSCRNAYENLVRFVDRWNVRAKKMEDE